MSNLRRRLAAAEARMNAVTPGIISIVVVNDPGRMGDSIGFSRPNHIRYQREPDESVEAFRRRAAREAERAGEELIFFSESEDRPENYKSIFVRMGHEME